MRIRMMVGCCFLCFSIAVSGCTQKEEWERYGLTDVTECPNPGVVKANEATLLKDKGSIYCAINQELPHLDQVTTLISAGLSAERINEYLSLPYYDETKLERYLSYDDGKQAVEDIVTYVNIGLDQPYFSNIADIEDTNNMLMLINKYHKLPDGYEPENLVITLSACVIGEDYSCQSETQYVVQEVANAFENLVQAAKKEGIQLKSIASYRSYAYQKNLYDYYANAQGQEYADTYYARPGQSEHNSGLAIDVTMDGYPFNEIEEAPNYSWLLEHMSDYGFILRYPKDKVAITGYAYESWHLRYVGIEAAKEIQTSGLTLDEYIARKARS